MKSFASQSTQACNNDKSDTNQNTLHRQTIQKRFLYKINDDIVRGKKASSWGTPYTSSQGAHVHHPQTSSSFEASSKFSTSSRIWGRK